MESLTFTSKIFFRPTLFLLKNQSPPNEATMNLFTVPTRHHFINICFETNAPDLKILRQCSGFISLSTLGV